MGVRWGCPGRGRGWLDGVEQGSATRRGVVDSAGRTKLTPGSTLRGPSARTLYSFQAETSHPPAPSHSYRSVLFRSNPLRTARFGATLPGLALPCQPPGCLEDRPALQPHRASAPAPAPAPTTYPAWTFRSREVRLLNSLSYQVIHGQGEHPSYLQLVMSTALEAGTKGLISVNGPTLRYPKEKMGTF